MSWGLSERAVVVMGKLPVPGRVKTRLGLEPEVAAELYGAFLRDVFDAAASALAERPGQGVFACALEPGDRLESAEALAPLGFGVVAQAGRDLGERMRHAWRSGQAAAAVVVGSDLPYLTSDKIVLALDRLQEVTHRRVVLIPAQDGGYVLVGMRREEAELFQGIPWSTPEVLARTQAAAARAGIELIELEPEADIDVAADLARLIRAPRAGRHSVRALDRLRGQGRLCDPVGPG